VQCDRQRECERERVPERGRDGGRGGYDVSSPSGLSRGCRLSLLAHTSTGDAFFMMKCARAFVGADVGASHTVRPLLLRG
jgi:hypothetical protein